MHDNSVTYSRDPGTGLEEVWAHWSAGVALDTVVCAPAAHAEDTLRLVLH